jgi:hypothetical protein
MSVDVLHVRKVPRPRSEPFGSAVRTASVSLTATLASRYLHSEMSARVEGPDPGSPDPLTAGLAELKRRLEEIMSRPKATVRDAEEAAEAAKALAELMRAEARALRLLRVSPPKDPAGEPAKPRPGGLPLQGLSLHEAAHRVLETWGWPMHVRELGVRIKSGGWRHPRSTNARPDQIQYQLAARLPRHPETFRRFAPNTFGLAAWGDSPPRREAPKPRLGIFRSPPGQPSAQWLSEHPDEVMKQYFEDESNQWRSS